MGNKQSKQSKDHEAVSRELSQMPVAYQDSYRLLSDLVGDRYKRHLLARLQGEEAQSMADFVNRVLEKETSLEHSDRKNALHTLSLLARSARVFPECLKLVGVECDFDSNHVHRGSCGDIYKGSSSGGQPVCVKVIRGNTTGYDYGQLLKIYAKEAILSAHMIHPNIIPFYGVCDLSSEVANRVCIIYEWMDNGDLVKYLRKCSDPPRYLLMSDIISGLTYMHNLSIIHSDVQAKNVLISKEGRALLADFGASRVSIATQTGNSAGGINWTSPEILLGKTSTATPQCDIWSFACTCYEIITGAQPFYEFSSDVHGLTSAFKDLHAIPKHPVLTEGNVDKRILKMMKRCWDHEPDKRPLAREICDFFRGLRLEDNREPRDSVISRVNSDNTEINYDFIYKILERVQVTPNKPGKQG